MGRVGALIALLALAGCDQLGSTADSILPTQLSLLVEQTDGSLLSVVVDLRRNTRHQLDVRVSRGPRFFDGRRLWEAFPVKTEDAYTFRFNELITHTYRDLPLRMATPPELLAIGRNEVWVGLNDRVFHCGFARWSCAPTVDTGKAPFDHPGPAHGFHVRQDGTEVWLTLPMDVDDAGEPILADVRRIVGLHWVHERFFAEEPVLDRLYRGRADLKVGPLSVRRDDYLDEWGDAVPLVVDSPWQVDDGADAWHGAQDGSFSLAAARDGGEICFAGRVRDDHLEDGDAMTIRVGEGAIDVPLSAAHREWFGVRFERCLPVPDGPDPIPFAGVFQDVDPGGESTRLASAPEVMGRATGTLRKP